MDETTNIKNDIQKIASSDELPSECLRQQKSLEEEEWLTSRNPTWSDMQLRHWLLKHKNGPLVQE